uniref:PLAT domain-containing protein n=1 Tax=Panagrolaimus davidi TaxID=227884 RepID=A0A914PK54_9BILA
MSLEEDSTSLATSGYINATLKTIDGKIIPIEKTKSPIIITGNNKIQHNAPIKIDSKRYRKFEVFDIQTFVIEQSNETLELEIKMIGNYSANISDIIFYMNYQTPPGPLPFENELNFTLNPNGTKNLFFDQLSMQNKTGRYYIALGYQNMSENNYEKVSYDDETYYTRKFPFIYSIKVKKIDDENLIKFYTHKMSVFSVESLSPKITENDAYQPTAVTIIKNKKLSGIAESVEKKYISEFRDTDGYILNNSDNLSNYYYQYIIAVQTSHKFFASTKNNVFISLFGTESETLARKLHGRMSMSPFPYKSFEFGIFERFLVCTDRPLGDIHFIKIWTDISGDDKIQSWHCEQIEIKDMQTNKHYLFEVKKWFHTPVMTLSLKQK